MRLAMRFLGMVLPLVVLACQPKSSVRFTRADERSPRTPQDTFGRVEFTIHTLDRDGCAECTVWLRWPGPHPGDTNASGARRVSQGTLGALGAGPYELRVEGPGLSPLVQPVDLPRRQTVHAAVRMVPARR